MPAYLLGVDIGTQGTKTCLYHESGALSASAFEASHLIEPEAGAIEQDPEEILMSVIRTIRCVMEKSGVKPSDVAAIGMDGQMAGIMAIDKDFNAVTPYDSWLDTRCDPEIAVMKNEMGRRIIELTGAPVSYNHGPKVLRWKRRYPEIYRKAAKFVLPVTFVAGKLCGLKAEEAYLDYTCMHFSGFGDVKNMCWSEELLEHFDIDREKMPRIAAPWEVVGKLTKEAAGMCGLTEDVIVCAGAGDQAATAFGAGIVEEGLAFDVAGTASVFASCTRSFSPDTENETLLYARSILPELWLPLAYIGGGGLCVRWIRDIFRDGNEEITYDTLAGEAGRIPAGSDKLMFIPHFSGRVCPNDPLVRGSFMGLTYRHNRAHMYRAVMESIGYEYAAYKRILSDSTHETPREVYAIGGGAKSDLFNQIKADILGVEYAALDVSDTGSWGSAMLAGYAAGIYPDLKKEAEKHVNIARRFKPDNAVHDEYQSRISLYTESVTALHDIYRKL